MSFPVTVISPLQVDGTGETGPFPFDLFDRHCLAQGDSWFSIGAIPPSATSNVLAELALERPTVIVNCARPGAQLSHMTDTTTERQFLRLLRGKLARKWHAILLSGAGNDVIDAAGVGPAAPPHQRLFLRPDERPAGPLTPEGYLSEAGWQTYADHLHQVFMHFVDLRDSGINRTTPIVLHAYAHLMPRPAGAGAGFGPWLHPSLEAFAVPVAERLAVVTALLDRMVAQLQALIAERQQLDPACQLHLVDTRTAGLVLSDAAATGSSGDFVNEIHPTRGGYRKLAQSWQQALDALL